MLVNTRLYLPEEWTRDRARMKAAGVPKGVRFQTRHEQALEMLDEQGHLLPHVWVTGDDEMGRTTHFRSQRGQASLDNHCISVHCCFAFHGGRVKGRVKGVRPL
ncbi:MAG: transposase [Planctomycetes bacterium]|nr:transposase [Planctomycetota bacterium]